MTKTLLIPDYAKAAIEAKKKAESKQKAMERVPQPTGWRILVMPYRGRQKPDGGVYIPDAVADREALATVVAYVVKVGPLAYKDPEKFGADMEPWCKEGDWVCIGRYAGSRFKLEDGEVRIINDDEVIATIIDPEDIKIQENSMSEAEVKENQEELDLEVEIEDDPTPSESNQVVEQQTPSEDAGEETTDGVEATEDSEDNAEELSEYTQGVQKRIDRLTNKRREAERREQAALEYAESMKNQLEQMREQNQRNASSLVGEFGSRVESELEAAKIAYQKAHEEGDGEALFQAQQKISQIAIDQAKYQEARNRLEVEKEAPAQTVDPVPAQTRAPAAAQDPDPKAQAWADKNDWFGEDQSMTYAAFGIHRKLVEEGYDPSSDDYYAEIDRQMKEDFPSKFEKSAPKSGKPPVAAATNSSSRSPSKRKRTIKLTESEKAIARKLNVPYEAYAKEVAKLNKDR